MTARFRVEQLAVGGFDHNFSYLIVGNGGEAALVDPTGDLEVIRAALARESALKPQYILLTHGHRDHREQVTEARTLFPAPVLAHPEADIPGAMPLIDGQHLPLGEGTLEVLFTPGHSADSVCYRLDDDSGLFTGDTLFVGCCGYGDAAVLYRTLAERILPLADSNWVYSGHDYGATPKALLGEEKRHNPFFFFVSPEEFRELLQHL